MNAPFLPRRPMRHIESAAVVDFADIYRDDVEMVSVRGQASTAVVAAVDRLLSSPGLQAQWVQGQAGTAAPVPRQGDTGAALQVLRDDMDEPVEILRELLGCDGCGVRIRVLEGPMCPRFHVDRVPCRMLMTYTGPGTEWIAHHEVDEQGFATGAPHPTVADAPIRTLPAGVWSLLKGGLWHDHFGGVVHRSPALTQRRLLATLDPIFPD